MDPQPSELEGLTTVTAILEWVGIHGSFSDLKTARGLFQRIFGTCKMVRDIAGVADSDIEQEMAEFSKASPESQEHARLDPATKGKVRHAVRVARISLKIPVATPGMDSAPGSSGEQDNGEGTPGCSEGQVQDQLSSLVDTLREHFGSHEHRSPHESLPQVSRDEGGDAVQGA